MINRARLRSGLSGRELARRAGTSHATLAAYESGAKIPRFDTLVRIVRATGFEPETSLSRRADATPMQREAKGRELVAVLELASQFPARHDSSLRFPAFPPAP